ncbi:MAG: 50S ribosomal protein L4 [Candidatus Omnitrophica bacterium]|nr:50S ribosomal protein L4 [Candidatus Omnitrophota bacterium]
MAEKIKVINQDGKQTDELVLNAAIFNAPINRRLLDLVVIAYAGNKRRGLADTKTRREISGGGKKPWKQKGTGNARQGSTRAPQWRHGGTIFGPQPRSYRTEIPEKMKLTALVSALSQKNKENKIIVLNSLALTRAKTKDLCKVIKNIKLDDSKSLFLTSKLDEKLRLASRNVHESFKIQSATNVNAYEVLRRKNLVIEKDALGVLENRILKKA